MFDFEAYASKKHVVYPELYSLAFELWDELSGFGFKFGLKIELAKVDLEDLDNDTLELSYNKEIAPISDKFGKAYNYFYKNELYLSKDTAKAYTETLESLWEWRNKIDSKFYIYKRKINWRKHSIFEYIIIKENKGKCKEKINILKETIYKELSYTHFEEPEKK